MEPALQTRDFLQKEDPEMKIEQAWESLYIAEGSDWFWWYGDDHSSENDEIFDFLFRKILRMYIDSPVRSPQRYLRYLSFSRTRR